MSDEYTTIESCIRVGVEVGHLEIFEADDLRAELAELREKAAKRDDWQALAAALDEVCACYRLQRRPSERLFMALDRARAKTEGQR